LFIGSDAIDIVDYRMADAATLKFFSQIYIDVRKIHDLNRKISLSNLLKNITYLRIINSE